MQPLLTDPFFYVFVVAVLGAGRWAVKHLVKNAVEHQFALRIESHKSELQRIAEQERFDLQRKLAASSLYLERQHSAAAEIYSAVRITHGEVGSLFGIQRSLTLDDCNEQDLKDVLKQFDVLEGKQDELLALWKRDRKTGINAIQDHLFELRVPRAEMKLQEARNLMYLNEIYFSDDTIKALDGFVATCNEWIARAMYPPQRGEKVKMVDRGELNASLEAVQKTLRTELSDPPPMGRTSRLPSTTAPLPTTSSDTQKSG